MLDWLRRRSAWSLTLIALLLLGGVALTKTQYHDRRVSGRTAADWSLVLTSGPQERQAAEAALRELGSRAVPSLRRALRTRDSQFAPLLLRVARKSPAPVRQRILGSLYPDAATKRVLAARALGVLGPAAATAIPDLAVALHDQDARVAYQATTVLARLGPAARPALLNNAQSPDPAVRQVAVHGLGLTLTQEAPELSALLRALQDTNAAVRQVGSNAFLSLRSMPTTGLVALVEQRRGPVRELAALALKNYRVPARRAQPALLDMLGDESPAARCQAVETLAYLHPWTPAVFAGLVAALHDPEEAVRRAARNALGPGNPRAGLSLPLFTQTLSDTNAHLREWSACILGHLGSNSAPALPALAALAADTNAAVRAAAREAQARIRLAAP
jgi:hypothetical protein